MRGIVRQLAVIGLAASTATFAFDGVPGAAGDVCAPRTVSVLDASADEGNPPGGGTLNFTVGTVGCAGGSVDYQAIAGAAGLPAATAGGDFVVKSGTLTWAPGDTRGRTVSIDLVGDLAGEADEGITLKLATPIGLSISDGSGRGVIRDDDLTLDLLSEPFCPNEPCLTCWLVLQTNTPAPTDVTVSFATHDGTAKGGVDFVAGTDSVVIPRGATQAGIGIRLLNDTLDEPDEYFIVTLLDASAGRIGRGTVTVTIVDDDGPQP